MKASLTLSKTIPRVLMSDRLIATLYCGLAFPFWVIQAVSHRWKTGFWVGKVWGNRRGWDYQFHSPSYWARLLAVAQGHWALIHSDIGSTMELHHKGGAFSVRELNRRLGLMVHPSNSTSLSIWQKSCFPLLFFVTRFFRGERTPISSISWFGVKTFQGNQKEVLAYFSRCQHQNQSISIGYLNVHGTNLVRDDRVYAKTLSSMDLILPDGIGLRVGAKLRGLSMGDNLNGTDFLPYLLALCAEKEWRVFFLGGKDQRAQLAAEACLRKWPNLQIVGCHHGYFSGDDDVVSAINQTCADVVLVGMGSPYQEQWVQDHRQALGANIVMTVGGLFDFYSGKVKRAPLWWRQLGLEWLFRLLQEPQRLWRRYVLGNVRFFGALFYHYVLYASLTRLIDIVIASLALILWFPFHWLVVLVLYCEHVEPILFKQVRIGVNGKRFVMYKYRSMTKTIALSEKDWKAGKSGQVRYKNINDPRITPIGHWLRCLSIDEVPQFWNVLKGEMTLVGPRPALPTEVVLYSPHERKRLSVKPGMTGVWQVSGRSYVDFNTQVQMDLDYINERSFGGDIRLLLKTVPAVLSMRGAM